MTILPADAGFTIRHLALVARLMEGVAALGEELQLALGTAELTDKVEPKAEAVRRKYYAEVARLERISRRFRSRYSKMSFSRRFAVRREDIVAAAQLAREELLRRRRAKK